MAWKALLSPHLIKAPTLAPFFGLWCSSESGYRFFVSGTKFVKLRLACFSFWKHLTLITCHPISNLPITRVSPYLTYFQVCSRNKRSFFNRLQKLVQTWTLYLSSKELVFPFTCSIFLLVKMSVTKFNKEEHLKIPSLHYWLAPDILWTVVRAEAAALIIIFQPTALTL